MIYFKLHDVYNFDSLLCYFRLCSVLNVLCHGDSVVLFLMLLNTSKVNISLSKGVLWSRKPVNM
jgi:hypothetical protein